MDRKIIALYILALFIIPLVSAVPTTNIITNGLVIEHPYMPSIPQNEKHDFYIHVYNQSNGVPVNSGISCFMHIYDNNKNGEHIFEAWDTTATNYDYEFSANAANFTIPGYYALVLSCNNSILGGYIESTFEVTPRGQPTDAQSISTTYCALLFFIFALFGLTLFGAIKVPWGHQRSDDGHILSMNYLRYAKIFLWLMAYTLLIMTTYLAWGYASIALHFDLAAKIFEVITWMLFAGLLPAIILTIIIAIVNVLSDIQIKENMWRNLE